MPLPPDNPVSTSTEDLTPFTPAPVEPGQEMDVWWGGYAARTMLPAFSLCALLSASVVILTEMIWREDAVSPALLGHLALYLVVVIWAVALSRWAYLTVSVAYRVTTHRFYYERGFGHPARAAIELAHVTAVRVEQKFWERWVGVGRLRVETEDGRVTTLVGVRAPELVAVEVLRFVGQVRAQRKG
jgi:uncharacterized membrane protein YdbT with pleckstrin-like domain